MRQRLHDKKAGVVLLVVLFVLSLAETLGNLILNTKFATFNLGEPFATMIFAAVILILTFMKKDRICYICYGAWIAWFVMEQIFEFPGIISTLCSTIGNIEEYAAMGAAAAALVSITLRMATMICIVVIGVLLVEYMNDGTIYNKAFNAFCVITVLLLLASAAVGLARTGVTVNMTIYAINALSRITMLFLFAFFAYDSAKLQLKKANLAK